MTTIQQFDSSVDVLQTILWQYSDATNLQELIELKAIWLLFNNEDFWLDWYTNVFNLTTANLFGLAVWSRILNLPLFVPLAPDPIDKPIWGFNAYDPGFPTLENTYQNFNNGNFSTVDQTASLTLEEQRFILRLRYFQLVTRGAIPEINTFLAYLIGSSAIDPIGNMYVMDGFDMSITYVFDFDISTSLRDVLVAYDLLPRPAGVGIKYTVLTGTVWGFGNNFQNFQNGNFIPPFI